MQPRCGEPFPMSLLMLDPLGLPVGHQKQNPHPGAPHLSQGPFFGENFV